MQRSRAWWRASICERTGCSQDAPVPCRIHSPSVPSEETKRRGLSGPAHVTRSGPRVTAIPSPPPWLCLCSFPARGKFKQHTLIVRDRGQRGHINSMQASLGPQREFVSPASGHKARRPSSDFVHPVPVACSLATTRPCTWPCPLPAELGQTPAGQVSELLAGLLVAPSFRSGSSSKISPSAKGAWGTRSEQALFVPLGIQQGLKRPRNMTF